jgi:PBSX family phage portal protein
MIEINELNGRTEAILKAVVLDAASPLANSNPNEAANVFSEFDAIDPPYDPAVLCRILEHSNSLRQNVDAYATNIDGCGHRLESIIDFDAENIDHEIARIIKLEQFAMTGTMVSRVPAKVIAQRRRELHELAAIERAHLDTFFASCCFDHSFTELRKRARSDLEITGNAYWEVVRNAAGRITRLVHVPSHMVRLLPLDTKATTVTEKTRIGPVSYEEAQVLRKLRRYVQKQGHTAVFFKTFGDTRVMGKMTGTFYPDQVDRQNIQPGDAPASELIHFSIHSATSPYGVPRWIGSLLSVLGSRQMEEVNYLYFNNKSVPPLALLVSGGKLSDASVPRVQNFIEENLKGKNNFHKILILEAESAGSSDTAKMKIELKPLTNAQQQDALFQNYDERNIDKVGASFRIPRILRGESKDFNRAVADAQMRFCEDQVFQPERAEFDHFMNHRILPDMGIRMWRFKSQSPITRDPERLGGSIESLVRVGVLTPEEGRELAADVFNREFRNLRDDWVKRPITLTLAGVQNQRDGWKNVEDTGDRQAVIKGRDGARARLRLRAEELVALRKELRAYEGQLSHERVEQVRDHLTKTGGQHE